jgi:hypothetical protein
MTASGGVNALHAVTSIGRPRGTDSRNRTRTAFPLSGQTIIRRLVLALSTSNSMAMTHTAVITITTIIAFLTSTQVGCMDDAVAGLRAPDGRRPSICGSRRASPGRRGDVGLANWGAAVPS